MDKVGLKLWIHNAQKLQNQNYSLQRKVQQIYIFDLKNHQLNKQIQIHQIYNYIHYLNNNSLENLKKFLI